VKEVYHIHSAQAPDATESILLLEFSDHHLSYGLLNHSNKELYRAGYFTDDESDVHFLEKTLAEQRLFLPFYQVAISYHAENSLLIPTKVFDQDKASRLLQTMFGEEPNAVLMTEAVPEWQVHTIFSIDKTAHELIAKRFSTGKCWHASTVGLKNTGGIKSTKMILDFKTSFFSIILVKDQQLQLSQHFHYHTADDVLYYLLKISTHFSLLQDEVWLLISGLIEPDSSLYSAISQYFVHIELAELDQEIKLAEEFAEFPPHYFGSLNKLAACVS
jgi:hypothetical protein